MQRKIFKFLIGCSIFAIFFVACSNPENEARSILNQALLLKQDGKIVEAEEVLKKIASQYPQTKVATEALKELEQMKTEIAFSNIFSATSSYQPYIAKQVKAKVDIEGLETALKLYKLDNGMYPTTEQGLEALVSAPDTGKTPKNWREGGYTEKGKIAKDPWRNAYVYLSPGVHGEYDITSYGADGEPGGVDGNADIKSWELEDNSKF